MSTIKGGCICGSVRFEVDDDFATFKLCHCKFCQKSSGSAHVSNAFTSPGAIRWIDGIDKLSTFDVPKSEVRKVFCRVCGTSLPFVSQNERYLVVPVGSLGRQPSILPQEVQCWHERMSWYDHARSLDLRGSDNR